MVMDHVEISASKASIEGSFASLRITPGVL
jgi:hypothetical protein